MGECGCSLNDDKYWFPGPGESYYLLTLSAACTECDTPDGISLEHVKPGDVTYNTSRHEDYCDGQLVFAKWPHNDGVAIVTSLRRHEFIAKLLSHLVGVDSRELSDGDALDDAAADVILDEMYPAATVKPQIARVST